MICQAIVTKYFGPTNTRGSRIKASASAGSKTVPYDHALNINDNHAAAAKAFAEKLEWEGKWFGGGMPDESGNVYVCTSNRYHPDDVAFTVKVQP